MKPEVAEKLAEARDFYALAKTVLSLCEPFGPVHSFRLTHNPGVSRVTCFIELESSKEQPALARALGASGGFHSSVYLDIPVRKDFGRSAKVVSLAPSASAIEPRLAQTPPPASARPTMQVSS